MPYEPSLPFAYALEPDMDEETTWLRHDKLTGAKGRHTASV